MGAKPTAWEACRYLKPRILNHALGMLRLMGLSIRRCSDNQNRMTGAILVTLYPPRVGIKGSIPDF